MPFSTGLLDEAWRCLGVMCPATQRPNELFNGHSTALIWVDHVKELLQVAFILSLVLLRVSQTFKCQQKQRLKWVEQINWATCHDFDRGPGWTRPPCFCWNDLSPISRKPTTLNYMRLHAASLFCAWKSPSGACLAFVDLEPTYFLSKCPLWLVNLMQTSLYLFTVSMSPPNTRKGETSQITRNYPCWAS